MEMTSIMMQLPELKFAPTPPTYPLNYTSISQLPQTLQSHTSVEAMREMIFQMAVMQPVHIDPESVKPPKRRNVRISKDPQSVAARQRRERISERIRILQRLVPRGMKMDTASMLEEAVHYVKFLKKQVQRLEKAGFGRETSVRIGLGPESGFGFGFGLGFEFCPTGGGVYLNA